MINWTKIKSGYQSGRKVVTHNFQSDLPLVESNFNLKIVCWGCYLLYISKCGRQRYVVRYIVPKYILLDLASSSTDTVLSLSPQKSTVKIAIVYNFPQLLRNDFLYLLSGISASKQTLFYRVNQVLLNLSVSSRTCFIPIGKILSKTFN